MKKRFSCFFVFSVIASLAFTTVSSLSIANTYKKAIQTYEELSARESLIEQYVELAQEIPVSYVSDRAVQESTLMDTAIMATIPTQMSDLDTAYDLSDTCDDAIAARIEEYEKEKAEREAIQARTPDPSVAFQMASRPGMIGRLTIPSLGINVALYASNSQSVVDAADSAACFGFGSATVIGDHQDQGFSAIRSSYVGMLAYIDDGTSKRQLTCTGVTTGTNTGTDLINSSGVSASTYGGYVLYTCNSSWQDVTIVYFS